MQELKIAVTNIRKVKKCLNSGNHNQEIRGGDAFGTPE